MIHVSWRDAAKFQYLRRFFRLPFEIGDEGLPVAAGICVSHAEPLTRIGKIERRLIFPHGILERCRTGWPTTRSRRFSFSGLIDQKRRAVLDAWTRSQNGAEIEIHESSAGRQFPEKAWDPAYCDQLTQSQFVLCPAGDYVWSYRFFEAIFCGAIPIAEQECTAFEGFEYQLLTDDARSLAWSAEIAEGNYAYALKSLTVGVEDLDTELSGDAIFDGSRNEWHQVRETLREITKTLLPTAKFILIDQNAWNADELELDRQPEGLFEPWPARR